MKRQSGKSYIYRASRNPLVFHTVERQFFAVVNGFNWLRKDISRHLGIEEIVAVGILYYKKEIKRQWIREWWFLGCVIII